MAVLYVYYYPVTILQKQVQVKVKVTQWYDRTGTVGTRRYSSNPFITSLLEGDWVVCTTLRPPYPREKIRYPLYRRSLAGPPGRPGQEQKILSSRGFDPQTVQPVASRYENYAIPYVTSTYTRTYSYVAFVQRESNPRWIVVRKVTMGQMLLWALRLSHANHYSTYTNVPSLALAWTVSFHTSISAGHVFNSWPRNWLYVVFLSPSIAH